MMDKAKQAKLEKAGWTVSPTPDFLGLSSEAMELIDLKIELGEAVKAKREVQKLSQAELAKRLATSQPRLVKIEQGEASLDLLMRALLVLGERAQAARIIGGKSTPRKAPPPTVPTARSNRTLGKTRSAGNRTAKPGELVAA